MFMHPNVPSESSSGFPVQLGLSLSGAAKAVIRTVIFLLLWMLPRCATLWFWSQLDSKGWFASHGCCVQWGEENIWTNKWFVLVYCVLYTYLCARHRWLISNCLVSFSVIKFSLSPMLTTLGSSSPVVQMGELSSGTWMLRGRR